MPKKRKYNNKLKRYMERKPKEMIELAEKSFNATKVMWGRVSSNLKVIKS